ncbi:MAG: DUF1905 domain-containing protein [Robiginitomaculum sp.]|nr:DUF1905 domain-containing protein [Robiginitomaculum sp.]MDQ7077730.1 DUF1905 domain-containing protein [Robiginitomaculum sp.]
MQKLKPDLQFEFTAALWLYPGKAAWHFVTVPKAISEEIKFFTSANKTAWGSVRVGVRIGQSQWNTSLFPDKKSGCYFLPIKAEIRKKEKISTGDALDIQLDVLV